MIYIYQNIVIKYFMYAKHELYNRKYSNVERKPDTCMHICEGEGVGELKQIFVNLDKPSKGPCTFFAG